MSVKPLVKQGQFLVPAARAAGFTLPKLVGQAAMIAGVTLGAEALAGLVRRAMDARDFSSDYRRMLDSNPDLQGEDAQRVMDRYRILSRFGPSVARDPVVAGHWIKQTLEYPVVTPTVLKDVVEVEAKMRSMYGPTPQGLTEAQKGIAGHLSKGMLDKNYLGGLGD